MVVVVVAAWTSCSSRVSAADAATCENGNSLPSSITCIANAQVLVEAFVCFEGAEIHLREVLYKIGVERNPQSRSCRCCERLLEWLPVESLSD